MSTHFKPGDYVVYRKQKLSVRPGRHARGIYPTAHGDDYSYYVNKYWRVISIEHGQEVVVRTRRGKQHTILANDPALRRANWWERLLFRRRFPTLIPAR